MLTSFRLVVCLAFAGALIGCGGGSDFEMASVKGVVTSQGKPVTAGTIVFSPKDLEDAPIASGQVGPDGAFNLSEKAVVGTHNVAVQLPQTGPPPTEEEEDENEGPSYESMLSGTTTVTNGENDLKVEVEPRKGPKKPRRARYEVDRFDD